MLSKIHSYGIFGLDAYPVTIEVDVSHGLPATTIVGLPDDSIRESKERVRSAIKNSGFEYPADRITINLSPADIRKEGPSFDLAIALGILAASQQINAADITDYIFLGELSLDGRLQPINGVLTVALSIQPKNHNGLFIPTKNAEESSLCDHIPIIPAVSLSEVVYLTHKKEKIQPQIPTEFSYNAPAGADFCFSDVKGQPYAKRGLEIAAAGGHNCLLIGPPGSGKTMLAQRIISILPPLNKDEALEISKIYSVMGMIKKRNGIILQRPFRSPHHTGSAIALVGGGSHPKPGEVTLSHNGVLFLDELPEFDRDVLEALRQPLEDQIVTVARASRTLQFPARFMLIAAMNPCPCGWITDPRKKCHCSSAQIQKYMNKISGPLLDRIDIHLHVPVPPAADLTSPSSAESSQTIRQRTSAARIRQAARFQNSSIRCNAQMDHRHTRKFCLLTKESQSLLTQAMREFGFSARAYDKILRIARTISDLDESDEIKLSHIAEALTYRSLDRTWH